jgi:hypothetical protein
MGIVRDGFSYSGRLFNRRAGNMIIPRDRDRSVVPATLESLQRLWLMKLNGIAIIDEWITKTEDSEILAGLYGQLEDERRHTRLLGDQVKRVGGTLAPTINRQVMLRPFAEVRRQENDAGRLIIFYRAIKAYMIDRCSHIMPLVDAPLAQVLERIAREDEMHVRWAELRLAHLVPRSGEREASLLLGRVQPLVEATWGRPWRQLAIGV